MDPLTLANSIIQLLILLAENYQNDMKLLPEADRIDRAKHQWEAEKFWLDLAAKITKGIPS